jgi:hypothetical protein
MIRIIKYLKLLAALPLQNVRNENPLIMKLEEAKKDPDLVNEIYKQVNDAFISGGSKIEYVASIKFSGQQYSISGTYEDWAFFFGMSPAELT